MQNIECVFAFINVFIMLQAALLNGSKTQDACRFFVGYLTITLCTIKTINYDVVSTGYFVPENDAMIKPTDARWKQNEHMF